MSVTDQSEFTTPLSPEAEARVRNLMAQMTLEEKLAQLVGLWESRSGGCHGGDVAPMQDAMQAEIDEFEGYACSGLGQLARVFGTAPVEPSEQARALARKQQWLQNNTRLGIPALVHEECLTGLVAWKATTFPAPPAWGASFDPELVEQMGRAIGDSMRALGVHQGLAPVLDVVRDARWGRVEECISEDPLPRRHGRNRIRARSAERGRRRYAEALRRVLELTLRSQPGTSARRAT